jgi:hypothetical protein
MCLTVKLLSDRPLAVPVDETAYPSLRLHPLMNMNYLAQAFSSIRRITSATYAYDISPGGYCGCYFQYESEEEHLHDMADRVANTDVTYANTAEQAAEMYRSQVAAVNSFGRFLDAHSEAQLAVYVVWEHGDGQKEPTVAAVPPSYFSGPAFDQLPEDLLLTIVPEPPSGEVLPWAAAIRRTHTWLTGDTFENENPFGVD